MWSFHVVVFQWTARDYSEVRAARVARSYFVIRMKVLICGVVVAVAVLDAKAA